MVNFSAHPVDHLIRELIRATRAPTPAEIEQIIERMATAPFDPRDRSVPSELRGMTYRGQQLSARGPSLLVHLVERVVLDQQWSDGTTEGQYLGDLRDAVRESSARLVVYERRGGHLAGILVPNSIRASHRGPGASPWLYVVYSADRGIIVTGYQASSRQTLDIPEDARWLR